MFEIIFYKDKNGNSEIIDLLDQLNVKAESSKNARIQRNKILAYLSALSEKGSTLGAPYVKHIEGDIWELRPLNNRIFYFCWHNDKYVLLHSFTKKTQKTPKKEIDKAKHNMNDWISREG